MHQLIKCHPFDTSRGPLLPVGIRLLLRFSATRAHNSGPLCPSFTPSFTPPASMSDHSSLRSWMDSAGLGHLTSHFIAQGVTEQNFPRLQLADFDRLGVISEGPPGAPPSAGQARQKLFKLIQVVRAESEREAQQNAAAAATLAANSISHAQARAQHYAHNARESTANSGEPTASYQPHIHAQWIPGGAQVAANASMSQHSQQSLRDDPPSSSSAFGLKSFFESARSGPAGALRSSPTSSPAQRPLNTQALNSNPEYLTLPLRANSILSPLRTFDSLAQSPAQSPAHSPARQSQHHREPPLSPNSPSKPPPAAIAAAAAFVARPMSPTSKPAQIYTYGSALNASSASQQQQPPAASVAPSSSVFTFAQSSSAAQQQPQPVQRTLAWGSAAVTPSTSAAPSQAPSVASSPQHPSSRPPPLVTATSSSSTTAAPSSFHARNFPSSPQSNSQQQQRAERSYHQHPAPSVAPSLRPEQPLTASHLTSSPISPRSSAALQAAHSALEQQRDRQRNERVAAAAVAAEASRERVQRERERLSRLQGHNSNEESKQSYQPAASPRVSATPQARPSSAATPSSTFAYPTHNQQQPHHRTLFQDQPEGQPSVPSTPSSSSYATSTNQPQRQSSNMYADRSSSNLNGPPPSARGGGGGGGRSFSPPPLSRMASARAPPAPAVPRSFGGQPLEEADFLDDDTNLANILFNTQEISLDGEEDEEEGEINGASAAAAVAAEAEDEGAAAASFYASASSAGNNAGASSKIRVAVRKRPLNARERARNESDITSVTGPTGPTSPTTRSSLANHSPNSVTIHEPKVKVDLTKFVESHTFHFDCAFGAATTNGAIYSRLVQPLVGFVMAGQGGRASCFAYGQTGAGKTHTLMGPEGGKREQSGLYVLAAEDIFRTLRDKQLEERVAKSRAGAQNQQRQQGQQGGVKYAHCSLFVSFFEIYSGRLFDLLHSRSKLVCRTDSNDRVHVVGLREKKVTDVAQLLDVITQGNKQRSTGQTGANVDSSRSHAILSISLKQIVPMAPAEVGRRAPLHHPTPDPSDPSAPASSSSASVFGSIVPGGVGRGGGQFRLKTVGKLSFIDLAGSERGADTAETDRRTRTEGAEINKSLLALKECWRALDQGGRHLPVSHCAWPHHLVILFTPAWPEFRVRGNAHATLVCFVCLSVCLFFPAHFRSADQF